MLNQGATRQLTPPPPNINTEASYSSGPVVRKPPSREETVERASGVRRPGAGGRWEAQGGEAFATSPKSTDGLQQRWEPLKGPSCRRVGTAIQGARSHLSPVTSLTV